MGCLGHLGAILLKEWLQWKRNIASNLIQTLIPFALMGLVLLVNTLPSTHVDGGPNYEYDVLAVDVGGTSIVMGDIPNTLQHYRFMFSELNPNESLWFGVVDDSDFAHAVAQHMGSRDFLNVKTFPSQDALVEYAAHPVRGQNDHLEKLITGVIFDKQGQNKEYAYRIFIDKDSIVDVSSDFVDPLKSYPCCVVT